MILSFILLGFVGLMFLTHPKFNQHPYGLLGLACLVESSLFLYSFYFWIFCDEYLSHRWLKWIGDRLIGMYYNHVKESNNVYATYSTIHIINEYLAQIINITIFVDLYSAVKKPFVD